MLHWKRWRGASLLAAAALLCAAGAGTRAQEKKTFEKHDAAALNLALRDVINTGAKLYNENGDHAGCFRMYEGALIAVKPFVAPDLQKKIDASLGKCDQLGSYAERSFELRKILDEIRERTKGPGDGKAPAAKGEGTISGKVTFEGKPVAGGYVVVLIGAEKNKFSAAIHKDGTFTLSVPVGEYRVAIEPIPGAKGQPLPPRYNSPATSSLAIRVQPGKQDVDLNLVN